MFPRFSLRHLRDVFLDRDFVRGRRYFEEGRVVAFDVVENGSDLLSLVGRVRGSGGRAYTQEIDLQWHECESLDVFSTCSCPVAGDCKHVVAVCLMARRYLAGDAEGLQGDPSDDRLRRWLSRVARAGASADAGISGVERGTARDAAAGERLFYVIVPRQGGNGLGIELRVVRPLKNDGRLGKGRVMRLDTLLQRGDQPGYLSADDDEILRLLAALCPEIWNLTPQFTGRLGHLALQRMLDTGRCVIEQVGGPCLRQGEPRPLDLAWRETGDGRLWLDLSTRPEAMVLGTDPALYLDFENAECGAVDTAGLGTEQLRELEAAPSLLAGDAQTLSRLLTNEFPELPLPVPSGAEAVTAEARPLTPCLELVGSAEELVAHGLRLGFRYGEQTVPVLPAAPQSLVEAASGTLRVPRDPEAEAAAFERLRELGFRQLPPARLPADGADFVSDRATVIEAASHWSRFLGRDLPALRENGWQVETDASFNLRFHAGDWQGEVSQSDGGGNDWFSLRFDLDVNGSRVPLLPLLMPLLELGFDRPLPAVVSLPLSAGPDADGARRFVDLPTDRLRPFLDTLRDLYDRLPEDAESVPLSRFDAAAVARLRESGAPVRAPAALLDLAERLAGFEGIEPAALPTGLRAELRGYQRRGLDWLQFLRSYDLGGILADDMGLGKTLQTLAHLLLEKEQGRLDRPALIVAPTSLMSNWRREAACFTPALSVLTLHGPGRHDAFPRVPAHDVVLTTYPLLPRDADALEAHAYHAVILDEAQTVKNPRSRAAAVVRRLDARHRLCLTGTPMENHLGELWALFDFLLPGFLSSEDGFREHWRKPIEEDGDNGRREALARRVAPFLLRRRKQDVLSDLPPKTEILRTVSLGDEQAALYESVRLAMEDRVRAAISAQGLARSHITILDALLKLRQICCDPRLVQLEAARGVQESAKLELLMGMLPEMLEEGRRVLVFSQFTSMLALVQAELEDAGIRYSVLTGQTRDRDAALDRFRNGTVDLMLISLKAGGVGLNLTEADTVVLYDPWWNPAVEAQAADRAHRIGQTRGVFVYKLVTEGTVEERILALQARKRALADGVYRSADPEASTPFDPDELQTLLTGPPV